MLRCARAAIFERRSSARTVADFFSLILSLSLAHKGAQGGKGREREKKMPIRSSSVRASRFCVAKDANACGSERAPLAQDTHCKPRVRHPLYRCAHTSSHSLLLLLLSLTVSLRLLLMLMLSFSQSLPTLTLADALLFLRLHVKASPAISSRHLSLLLSLSLCRRCTSCLRIPLTCSSYGCCRGLRDALAVACACCVDRRLSRPTLSSAHDSVHRQGQQSLATLFATLGQHDE